VGITQVVIVCFDGIAFDLNDHRCLIVWTWL